MDLTEAIVSLFWLSCSDQSCKIGGGARQQVQTELNFQKKKNREARLSGPGQNPHFLMWSPSPKPGGVGNSFCCRLLGVGSTPACPGMFQGPATSLETRLLSKICGEMLHRQSSLCKGFVGENLKIVSHCTNVILQLQVLIFASVCAPNGRYVYDLAITSGDAYRAFGMLLWFENLQAKGKL